MNRFNQPVQNAGYTPLSFQELAFAPVQLRQREDRMADQQDEILNQMNNIVGYEGFDEETNKLKGNMQNKLESLAGKIQKDGSGNINHMNEFRNIRNEYNKLVSKTGALGMSSALKENLDTQKAAYYQMGLANGQSAADIERNWQGEVDKYTGQLPGSINDLKGQIPTFTPKLPPKHEDMALHATRLKGIMGNIEDKHGKITYDMEEDDATGESRIVMRKEDGSELTNEPNIEKFKQYMENQILDPNSSIGQDMAFKGLTPEQVIENVDLLGDIMTIKKSSEVTEEKAMGGGTGSGSGNSGSSDTPEIGEVSLTTADGTAAGKVESTETVANIDERMESLRRDNEIPQADKERQLTELRQARRIKAKHESSSEFINAMDKQISDNKYLRDLGVYNWNDYQQLQKQSGDNVEMIDDVNYVGVPDRIETDDKGVPIDLPELPKKDIAKKFMKPLYKKANEGNPILAQGKQYTFGHGKTDLQLHKQLGAALPVQQVKSLLSNAKVSVSNDDVEDLVYNDVVPGSEQHEKLQKALMSGDVKFTFGAINSGTEMTGPELMFSMNVGSGKDARGYDIAIDIADSGYGQELLDPEKELYKTLDPEGRKVIDAIRDNIEYAGLPTHVVGVDDASQIYNEDKSTGVKALSQKRTNEQFGGYSIKNTEDPNELDELILDGTFIKDDGYNYAVRVNDDGSYSTYKSEPGSGREDPYTFGDYIEKETMASFAKLHMKEYGQKGKNTSYTAETLKGTAGKLWKDKMKARALNQIVANVTDINNLENDLIIYNDSKGFMDVIQEWYKYENKDILDPETASKANEVYEKLKGYTVNSKRKKMIL